MLAALVFETPPPLPPSGASGGFSFGNLFIVAIVFAIAYPLVTRLRTRVSERRVERWAREEGWPDEPAPSSDSSADDDRGGPAGEQPSRPSS